MHSERLGQLQKRGAAVVGRVDFPPKLKSEQSLVETPRPFTVRDAKPNVIENRSVRAHYNLPYYPLLPAVKKRNIAKIV
jgi:hypothetical protein